MIEILLNDVTLDGMRRLKVVSDSPIASDLLPVSLPDRQWREWKDDALGLHYLEATWPCREVIEIKCEGWIEARPFMLWKLEPGQTVRTAFALASIEWTVKFNCFPDFVFMRKLPKVIENGFEIDDVTFMEADWVPSGCIAVGTPTEPPPNWKNANLGEEKRG